VGLLIQRSELEHEVPGSYSSSLIASAVRCCGHEIRGAHLARDPGYLFTQLLSSARNLSSGGFVLVDLDDGQGPGDWPQNAVKISSMVAGTGYLQKHHAGYPALARSKRAYERRSVGARRGAARGCR
jgi:hypothetical protein